MLKKTGVERPSVAKVMTHPWMLKGYGCPPDNYMPFRTALRMPLDTEVIHKMTEFNFGSPEEILQHLWEVIDSVKYKTAVHDASNFAIDDMESSRRRGIFDFYKRPKPLIEVTESVQNELDGYHPWISIYHLVHERLQREESMNLGKVS